LKFSGVVYDSELDGKSNSIFKESVLNEEHLYFIVTDNNNNVFGHYHPGRIKEIGINYDPSIYMFTLYSNGRCGVMKFQNNRERTCTCINEGKGFYRCDEYFGGCDVGDINKNESYIGDALIIDYKVGDPILFLGHKSKFVPTRITVIKMN